MNEDIKYIEEKEGIYYDAWNKIIKETFKKMSISNFKFFKFNDLKEVGSR